MKILLVIIVVLLVAWTVGSYFFNGSVDSPKYSVLEKKNGYEIRSYDSYLLAQVEVSGTYDEALNKGFRLLADYIFGNNTKNIGIAMTAPVTESQSEKLAMTAPVVVQDKEVLAMTAPVIASGESNERIISFVMPFEYTLETLPKPNNPQVKIVQQPARKVAVLRFSWYATNARIDRKKAELVSYLQRDGISHTENIEYAGYNAPLSAPWLNRHEVMVEVR